MSDDRLDYDMSDVSVSDTASWADAQADTPTMGKNFSDSEDTLSNLSFDNELVENINGGDAIEFESVALPQSGGDHPLREASGSNPIGGSSLPEIHINLTQSHNISSRGYNHSYKSDDEKDNSTNTSSSSGIHVQVCVTTADITAGAGGDTGEFQLNLPPGVEYQAPSVDFPSSPSQIKFSQGESFLPKEEAGLLSEDDTSFASSRRAHLDLNLQNGDAGVRLSRKEESSLVPKLSEPSKMSAPTFQITEYVGDNAAVSKKIIANNNNNLLSSVDPESLAPTTDNEELDDYMEDFYLPISNESVMSRQTSFRRKVQKQLDSAAAETAIHELNKFERMLTAYDEEPEHELTDEETEHFSTPKARRRSSSLKNSPLPTESETMMEGDHNSYDPERSLRLEENSKNITFGRGTRQAYEGRLHPSQVRQALNFDDEVEPQSILDIDAICESHAPNLMNKCAKRDSNSSSNDSDVVEYENINNRLFSNSHEDDDGEPQSLLMTTSFNGELESGFFLQKSTLDKLTSVYDLTNFTNLYTLSGELKHILSPVEIEEIVMNRIHLENIIDPKVMAALSWSMSGNQVNHGGSNNAGFAEVTRQDADASKNHATLSAKSSLAPPSITIDSCDSSKNTASRSKNSSISAGFHSQSPSVESLSSGGESSDDVENHENHGRSNADVKQEPESMPASFVRGIPQTASLRRKISIEDATVTSGLPAQKYVDELPVVPISNPILKKLNGSSSMSGGHNRSHSSGSFGNGSDNSNSIVWRSLESLDDLDIEDDIESGNESDANNAPKIFLVRRDSKRFNKRVVQGLFVESNNGSCNGTLKRIRAPLHLSEDYTAGTSADLSLESPNSNVDVDNDEVKHLTASAKKRISVDEKILSVASELDDSSQATNADLTQSDIFHSIMSSLKDEDPTIRSDDDDDEIDEITLDLDTTPDDMEDSILGNLEQIERVPQVVDTRSNGDDDQSYEEMRWRSFRVGANDIQIDMKAIEPYRRVLSHGGYFDVEKNVSIILFSGCYLPDRSRREYSHLMDHLFLYVLSGLEELIAQDYILVYLHGACPKSCQPTFGWLKRCYQLIDHKLRKNLKSLYLVHPTFWLRTVVALTKPFISSKFSQKIQFVNTLAELCLEIPTEHLAIPEKVLQYDFDMKIAQLKKQDQFI